MFLLKDSKNNVYSKYQLAKLKYFISPKGFSVVDFFYIALGTLVLNLVYDLWHLHTALNMATIILDLVYIVYTSYILYVFRFLRLDSQKKHRVIQRQFVTYAIPIFVIGVGLVLYSVHQGWNVLIDIFNS